jgi:hypothetical protein
VGLTGRLLEDRDNGGNRRHRELAETTGRDRLLEGETRAMADGARVVHLDELAQVGERSLHLGVDLSQGCPLDGALEKVGSKRCVGSNGRVTAEARLIPAAFSIDNRMGPSGSRRCSKMIEVYVWALRWRDSEGDFVEEGLYVAEAVFYAVYLSLTITARERADVLSRRQAQEWCGTYYWEEMRTRWRDSLGRWPAPVEVHVRLAVRQLEHGHSLSQRTWSKPMRLEMGQDGVDCVPCGDGTGHTECHLFD